MWFFEDLKYGLRGLAKNRSFTFIAVLSLALGIGANTTIFTLLNAILLRSLPVADAATLAAIYTVDRHSAGRPYSSYPNFKDYRDRNTVFSSLTLYTPVGVNLTGRGDPQRLLAALATSSYFSTLGVKPIIGRGFLPEEDVSAGASPVVVISYRLWNRLLAGDPRVLGRTLDLSGRSFTIVGVAPQEFQGIDSLYAADLWTPMIMYRQLYPMPAWVNQRRALLFSVVGRLKPGIGIPQAEASMQVIVKDLEREYPRDNAERRIKLIPLAEAALSSKNRESYTQAGSVLMIVSALVLLIACGNVASLLLARAAGRAREIAVRLAIGANRWQIIRQMLVESSLLALAGALLGLLIARWARDALWAIRPPAFKYATFRLDVDTHVLGYALGISVATALLFGLFPALRSSRADLATDLKERTGQPASSGGKWPPRSLLVMGQVALSLVTLIGAGLFLRSLRSAGEIDPGFDAGHLSIIIFNLSDGGYNEGRGREFLHSALQKASGVPGVESATLAKDVPFQVTGARTVLVQGQDNTVSAAGRVTLTSVTAPGYFQTVKIPVLRGRDFSPFDVPGSPRVAIVNEAAAAQFWPGENATGKVIQFYGENLPVQIVGVARNANYQVVGEPPQAMIYLSMGQYYFPLAVLYIRTSGDPDAILAAVRHAVQALDHNLLLQSETVRTTISDTLWAQRLSADLLAIFGGLALLLAAIGIYGVISYSVNLRAREIGVRVALGATPGNVQMLVLGEGIRLVAIGTVAGMGVALAFSRWVQSMLFVISARDALTFILVPCVLILVAIFACWLPAHRAIKIDPAVALRDE